MADGEFDVEKAKDVEGSEAYVLVGMPDTEVFWNTRDTISIQQDRDGERVIVTVMPEMAERLCEMIRGVRDQMSNL